MEMMKNFKYLGYDGKTTGAMFSGSTFCSCCGSTVVSSKNGKQKIISADCGIRVIVDNVGKAGTYTRKLRKQDAWQEDNNLPAQRVVEVSQVETRNGPLTIAIRVV